MAGEQPRPTSEASEHEAQMDVLWKLAGDINASSPFPEPKQTQRRDSVTSSAWADPPYSNLSGQQLHSEVFQSNTMCSNASFMNTAPHHGHGFFGTPPSEPCWSSMEITDQDRRQSGLSKGSGGLSELMDIDVGFDTSFLSFTQCLQSGLQMDASDYSALSRSLGVEAREGGHGHHQLDDQFPEDSISAVQDSSHPASSGVAYEFPSLPFVVEEQAGGHIGDIPNVPTTPNSSISSSSTEGLNEEELSRVAAAASISGAKGPVASMPLDQMPTAEEDNPDKSSSEPKKQTKPRKKGQKRNREPRFAFMTKSDVDHLEDGYRWRKYGQKAVKNSPYPRSYYRCTNSKCSVKKRVERSFEDPSIVITTYEGQHTHQSPALLRGSAGSEAHLADRNAAAAIAAAAASASFSQTPFNFPLQQMMQVPPRTNLNLLHSTQQQAAAAPCDLQGTQHPPIPSPHPALQPQPQSHQADHGLLQDIVPSGIRKFS
eukprot:Gb_01873 [translate_table: standard]